MSKSEIIGRIQEVLDQFVTIADLDDDKFHSAMTDIRDIAWEGKELIHNQRMAEWQATRKPTPTKSRPSHMSKEELETLMKDLGL